MIGYVFWLSRMGLSLTKLGGYNMGVEYLELLPPAFKNWLSGRKVEEVECVLSDIAGISRGKHGKRAKYVIQTSFLCPHCLLLPPSTTRRHPQPNWGV